MDIFITFLISVLLGSSTLVIGIKNPIHSILILILVFFLGSILLFFLCMEYFALLFLIVYVGAIVVLFLFIIMMLEIKMVNSGERFSDLFSFKNLILFFILIEILLFSNENLWDLSPILPLEQSNYVHYVETNLYANFSKILHNLGQINALGGILFTQYTLALILISVLLFISMFGAIVLTLKSTTTSITKHQDAVLQGYKNSSIN